MPVKIAPSLAAAPLHRLQQVLQELESAGADQIHFDLEDGSFVPMMTLGAKLIPDLRLYSELPFDVHLMMVNPEWILPEIIRGGANRVSVHYEACAYPRRVLRQISSLGALPGIAFNPGTSIPDVSFLFPYLSFIVVLTTEPEVPDCPFLPEALEKVRRGKQDETMKGIEWVVDGGINIDNISQVRSAGADTLVIGRSVLKDGKIAQNMASLRNAASV